MKSKLNSNVTCIVKAIIFFTATVNDRFKIIIRNKKIEPIWLRYICTNLVIPMSLQAWKWKSRVLRKFPFYFGRTLHLHVKLFWTYGGGNLVTINYGHSGANQDKKNQKIADANVFLQAQIVNRTELQFQVSFTPDCSEKLLTDRPG